MKYKHARRVKWREYKHIAREAKNFARVKFDEGLVVFAGTINPQSPKQLIASSKIPDWLETGGTESVL
jgi:hypothetical protein